ncbi:MAG: hypothetical protein ACI4OU_04105 [Candidatus Enterenecus sp.]
MLIVSSAFFYMSAWLTVSPYAGYGIAGVRPYQDKQKISIGSGPC